MQKSHFETVSEHTLETLAGQLESADTDGLWEVEYSDGVLTITLPANKQYVLNRHRVTGQVWWSSPVSGAKYFSLAQDNVWRDKEGKELKQLLSDELHIKLN